MRKVFLVVGGLLLLYAIVSILCVRIVPVFHPSIKRLDVVNILIEFLIAVSTLSAVLWALFGDSFLRRVCRSSLILVADKGDSLCYLIKDEARVPDIETVRLEICVRIANSSHVVATNCQLVTNEILVSSDGVKFSKLRNICTAAFQWVYEDDYETDVRKGVDKFARILDIRQEVSKPAVVPGGKSSGGRTERTSLVLRLPDHTSNNGEIDLGVDYKGVMFPVKLVSQTEPIQLHYIQVIWQGKDLNDFLIADKLKVRRLNETEAKKDII